MVTGFGVSEAQCARACGVGALLADSSAMSSASHDSDDYSSDGDAFPSSCDDQQADADLDQQCAFAAAGPSLLDEIKAAEEKHRDMLADKKLLKENFEAFKQNGCIVCSRWDEPDGNLMLACDKRRKVGKKRPRCDKLCHLKCCTPPLDEVPEGDWQCPDCA